MSNKSKILSISLPYKAWDSIKRRWTLPIESINKEKTRLWIGPNEIMLKKFVIQEGFLEILDETLSIDSSTEVFIDLKLTSAANISPFIQNIVLALIAIIPAVFATLITYYTTNFSNQKTSTGRTNISQEILNGESLVSYDRYPIIIDSTKNLKLDKDNFMYNVQRFEEDILNPRAASDLIYLGQSNNIIDLLSEAELKLYRHLIEKYKFTDYDNFKDYHDNMFNVFVQIVDAIGKTFEGAKLEIVLHDARDPMHSVVLIKNNMTNRFTGSPATNLGIHFIKYFSQTSEASPPFLSYKLPYRDRIFKASTIPLYDKKYGLFAFICINLDVTDLVVNPSNQYKTDFIDIISKINTNQKIEEVLKK